MPRVYDQIFEGDWTPWAKGKGNRLQCCDCALVHLIELREKDGEIQTRMSVDHRSTAAIRRGSGITVTIKKPKKKS